MEGEEHARSGIGDGEPKVKGVDELVEDVDMLQESSSDSRGEDRRRDPTGEDPGDGGVPKPDQDLHGMDPEVAGDLRWSLRKKRAPCGGRVRHSSKEYLCPSRSALIRLLHPQHLGGIWSVLTPYRLPFDTLSEYPEPWLQQKRGSLS